MRAHLGVDYRAPAGAPVVAVADGVVVSAAMSGGAGRMVHLRHANGFWLVFHQLHHSPARLELLTSFYMHPVEIIADSVLTSFLVFGVLGGTAEAAAWTSFFGATGEYFYHSNITTPKWLGYCQRSVTGK